MSPVSLESIGGATGGGFAVDPDLRTGVSGDRRSQTFDSSGGEVDTFGQTLDRATFDHATDNALKIQGDPSATGPGSVADMLSESLGKVNQLQGEADVAIKNLVAGRTKNIHETLVTVERADLSLRLLMQVRNKIIDAYREIMKMQV